MLVAKSYSLAYTYLLKIGVRELTSENEDSLYACAKIFVKSFSIEGEINR